MNTRTKIMAALAAVALLGACSEDNEGRVSEENTAEEQLSQFLKSQPIPRFNYSQLRQNLIEIETAQSNTTATTSLMFLLAGVGSSGPLVHSCPSIGFPIPATYQLTNPQQVIGRDSRVAIPQLESNGVYTGDTTGTYVMCVGEDGKAFAFYHEGYVATVTGPAHWDVTKGEIVMDGTSTAEFSETEG
jgi:hypothetical protein